MNKHILIVTNHTTFNGHVARISFNCILLIVAVLSVLVEWEVNCCNDIYSSTIPTRPGGISGQAQL